MRIARLSDRPELRPALLALVKDSFPQGAPISNALATDEEFRLLLDPGHTDRNLLVLENDEVVATASWRPFPHPGLAGLRTAGIGLVVTRPDSRGKGFGAAVVQACEEAALKDNCALAILWSELFDYYAKLGYWVGGTEYQWVLDEEALTLLRRRLEAERAGWTRKDIEIARAKDLTEALDLYNRELGDGGPTRLARDRYAGFAGLPETEVFEARSAQGVQAYAACGKGRDLRDTVHELIGDPKLAPALLDAVAGKRKTLRIQISPVSPWLTELEHWIGKPEKTPLGFLKVLNGPVVVEAITRASVLPTGVRLIPMEGGFSIVRGTRNLLPGVEWPTLLQLFFGPWLPTELEGVSPELAKALESAELPLPYYFWGFDSV